MELTLWIKLLLAEYTVKQQTLRWPVAIVFNMIDITGFEHHTSFSKNITQGRGQRIKVESFKRSCRCMPSVEAQSTMLMQNHLLHGAVEMVLGRHIVT